MIRFNDELRRDREIEKSSAGFPERQNIPISAAADDRSSEGNRDLARARGNLLRKAIVTTMHCDASTGVRGLVDQLVVEQNPVAATDRGRRNEKEQTVRSEWTIHSTV